VTEEEGLSNLIARGLEGAALRLSSGEVRAGNEFCAKLVEEARNHPQRAQRPAQAAITAR
jgi:hypothetical protein